MKRILFLIFLIPFINILSAQNIKQDINEIRNRFKWINSQKDFQKVYFENDEFTDQIPSEGCQLDVFNKDTNIYKIIQMDAVSNAVFTTEYYLKNNKLIFVFRKEENFIFPVENDSITKFKTQYEERVYYKDKKIIRYLEKGSTLLNENIDYQKQFEKYKPIINTKIKYGKQYNLLQGTWSNEEDSTDWFIITGLIKQQYKEADPVANYRLWFDGRYLWFHNTENQEEGDSKYEILELNEKKLEMQDRLSGEVLFYSKGL